MNVLVFDARKIGRENVEVVETLVERRMKGKVREIFVRRQASGTLERYTQAQHDARLKRE